MPVVDLALTIKLPVTIRVGDIAINRLHSFYRHFDVIFLIINLILSRYKRKYIRIFNNIIVRISVEGE